MKYNGWQRLWIVTSSIYITTVIVFAINFYPNIDDVSPHPAFLYRLSTQSKNLLIDSEISLQNPSWKKNIASHPNGQIFHFYPLTSDKQVASVMENYDAILKVELPFERGIYLMKTVAVGISFPILIYLLGWSFAWIINGFKIQN